MKIDCHENVHEDENRKINSHEKKLVCSIKGVTKKNYNDLKFLDRYVWANSADPDQTVPRGAV